MVLGRTPQSREFFAEPSEFFMSHQSRVPVPQSRIIPLIAHNINGIYFASQ